MWCKKMTIILGLYMVAIIFTAPTEGKMKVPSTEKRCKKLHNWVQTSYLKVLGCFLKSSVPSDFAICSDCELEYANSVKNYTQLVNDAECKAIYINQDELNIIENEKNHFEKIWTQSHCENCFGNQTNVTAGIIQKLKDVNECFKEKHDVCQNCSTLFYNVSKDYYNFKWSLKNNVCLDVAELMNLTSHAWYKEFKCSKPTPSLMAFWAMSSVLSCIPFIFYAGIYSHGKRTESKHDFIEEDGAENDATENNCDRTLIDGDARDDAENGFSTVSLDQSASSAQIISPTRDGDDVNENLIGINDSFTHTAMIENLWKTVLDPLHKNVEDQENSSDDEPIVLLPKEIGD